MNAGDRAGFSYDFGVIRAAPGCNLDELKRCYRLAVRELHPDRNPKLEGNADAQEALRELTAAYRRLLDYHRVYGRLPGEAAAERHRGSPAAQAARTPAPVRRGRRRVGVALALVALASSVSLWRRLAEPPATATEPPVVPPSVQGPRTAARALGDAEEPAAPQRRPIRIGDTKLRVRAALGAPILGSAEVWEYGPSHVVFENGVVVDWYNSPLQPIAVDESSRRIGVSGSGPQD